MCMGVITYLVAYAGIIVFWAVMAATCLSYRKKPQPLRWELYPIAHERNGRAAYGGSYLEDTGWWRQKQKPSLLRGLQSFAVEFILLRNTFRNNRSLWLRTYPFHLGLYMLATALGLALVVPLLSFTGTTGSQIAQPLSDLGQVLTLGAFLGIGCGALGLIHRRLTLPDLRNFSTPEHFFNLGLFLGLSVLGLILWLTTPLLFARLCSFMAALITFSFTPQSGILFNLFLIYLFALTAYIPATHMGHFFMKYFLWHDIRWNDQPIQDNPDARHGAAQALKRPVTWKGQHIQGDGMNNWGDIAACNPAAVKKPEGNSK